VSTRQAQEQIITRFTDGKLLVDFRGNPQSNYATLSGTTGLTHRFNLLSRVIRVLNAQVEGTPYILEAAEYGTSNAIKLRFWTSTPSHAELADGATITPLTIDVSVIGY